MNNTIEVVKSIEKEGLSTENPDICHAATTPLKVQSNSNLYKDLSESKDVIIALLKEEILFLRPEVNRKQKTIDGLLSVVTNSIGKNSVGKKCWKKCSKKQWKPKFVQQLHH